jgi:sugar-specific transcriptional regulator TrmB
METEIIQKAGLSAPQAKTYLALIQHGALTPAQNAAKTGETRTNTYALLEKLEKLGLIKKTAASKTAYEAVHPSNLEILAEKRRRLMAKNEQELKANISALTDIFYAHNEMPGSKTLSGIDGIKEVYMDILRAGKDVHLLRTTADKAVNPDGNWWRKYRDQLPKKGIHTYAITPDTQHARQSIKSGRDQAINFHRTMMPKDAYTAPVALQIYGNKVALISFGETQMSTIITSPTIAEAMRQVFDMMRRFWAQNYPQPPNTNP